MVLSFHLGRYIMGADGRRRRSIEVSTDGCKFKEGNLLPTPEEENMLMLRKKRAGKLTGKNAEALFMGPKEV